MTDQEDAPQGADLDTDSSTDAATADFNEESGQEAAHADYQARLRDFDEVESTPVVSLPVESRDVDESELKLKP